MSEQPATGDFDMIPRCGTHGIAGCRECFGPYARVTTWVEEAKRVSLHAETIRARDATIARLREELAASERLNHERHGVVHDMFVDAVLAHAAATAERDSALADLAALRAKVYQALDAPLAMVGHTSGSILEAVLAILSPPEAPTDKGATP